MIHNPTLMLRAMARYGASYIAARTDAVSLEDVYALAASSAAALSAVRAGHVADAQAGARRAFSMALHAAGFRTRNL